MTTRKQYSKEFKLDAISLVLEQGYTRAEAARSLDIEPGFAGETIAPGLAKCADYLPWRLRLLPSTLTRLVRTPEDWLYRRYCQE